MIQGLPSFATVSAAPGPVDLAIVAVPANEVIIICSAYAAPAIGEHSLEILGEFGVDGETVAKLIAEGAVVAN